MSTMLLWYVWQGRETTSRLPLRSAPEKATEETRILSATHAKAVGRKQPHSLNISIDTVAAGAGEQEEKQGRVSDESGTRW